MNRPDQSRPEAAAGADMARLQRNALRGAMLLKAMSNPSRLIVLCQLAEGEKSVGELERATGLGQSALSQHLAILRRRKLASTRRAGQTIYYSLAGVEAAAVLSTLYQVFCSRVTQRPAPRLRPKAA